MCVLLCVVQEAFERLRSSMGMKREVFGECSEKVAETFHLMGAIRMAQGELPSAYRLMKKVCFSHPSN